MNLTTDTDVLKFIGALCVALGAAGGVIYGAIKALPILLSHARLLHERDVARAQVADLEAYIRTFDRVTDMLTALGDRVASMELRQAISTRFTCDLIIHIQEQRPVSEMPPIPPELNDDVIAQLRFRAAARNAPQ